MSNNLKTFVIVVIVVAGLAGGLIYLSVRGNKSDNVANNSENGDVAGASTEDQPSDSPSEDSTTQDQDYVERLAKALSEKGMVMYGAYWCPHCQSQKKLFGDAVKYIDYVECDSQGENANPDECEAKGITGYPTWIYQGQQYSGEQSLAELAGIIGFSK